MPRRSISVATVHISSSDGVIRPESPIRSASRSSAVSRISCAGDHDAEVDHIKAVAREHDADDVLADVVHIALDRRHDDPARAARLAALRVHERLQMRDRLFHHARGLDDLRQEHLARAEEVADDVHPVHQRPLDHRKRRTELEARLLGVLHDELVDPVDKGVHEALADRQFAPAEVEFALDALAAAVALGDLEQSLGAVSAAIENHILDALAQLRVDLLV